MKTRSLSATVLLLLVALTLGFEALLPASAQTPSPTPTLTATPSNPGDTLVIDLGDFFSPDLVAGAAIGTSGNPQFLYCAISIENGIP